MTNLTTHPPESQVHPQQSPQPQQPDLLTKLAMIWERVYPGMCGLLALGTALFVQRKFPELKLPRELGQLFSSTLDIGAIAIGFLATAKTVLLSIQGSPAVSRMRGSGLYEGLLKFILKAIQASFALAAYSLVCIFLEKAISEMEVLWELVVCGWLFLLVTAGLASYRVITVFFKILSPKDISTLRPNEDQHAKKPLQIIAPARKEQDQGSE